MHNIVVLLSAYRFMWVMVLFDLPVDTPMARRAYTHFRKRLLKDGFTRLQYSVYARHSSSEENATVHINRVQNWVPDDGEVRILLITDKQFERMRIFWGKMRKLPPNPAEATRIFLRPNPSKAITVMRLPPDKSLSNPGL